MFNNSEIVKGEVMKAVIIDDDLNFALSLNKYLTSNNIINLDVNINEFYFEYDIYFLDIDMPNDGISYAKKIKNLYPKSYIIFVSNRNDLVFDAMKVFPFSFVRKQKLLLDLPLVLNELNARTSKLDYLEIDEEFKVKLENIIYIEKIGSYLYINTKENIYKKRKSLQYLFEKLDKYFVFVNKGTIVNVRCIKKLKKNLLF